ncbi:MAG TPA: grasp-with-spasm system ATP-grasp peptide maturase [Bacteroidia bacterium]|jgi:ATP-GRASP peptide maturase of grasp-with-spasm system|nr:grasp-with-spasm system ATP-grasp peptide maturase [Bacteroidia bacterium]
MILILTKSLLEINSDTVMDWLTHYKADYDVITGDEFMTGTSMTFQLSNAANSIKIKTVHQKELDLDQVKTVWFRRRMETASFQFYEQLNFDMEGKQTLTGHLKLEFLRFYSLLPIYLKKAYWLSHPDKSSLNKLEVLILAKNFGITIPETIVCNFFDSGNQKLIYPTERYISKPLTETAVITDSIHRYSMLTKEVDQKTLVQDSLIFPSLLQKCIEKEFEIRTFYLSGKCYSLAIFSQESEKTKTDYRNYDTENQNRCVPYKLPKVLEKKIGKLMRALKLNAGSIDFIKTTQDEFVFLEINPVGQFDWVALHCNYPIEKDIAQHLIKKDNHEKRRAKNKTPLVAETIGS